MAFPAQTAQFGATKNDHFGDQIADHIGGNARWRHGKAVTPRLRYQPPQSVAATPRI